MKLIHKMKVITLDHSLVTHSSLCSKIVYFSFEEIITFSTSYTLNLTCFIHYFLTTNIPNEEYKAFAFSIIDLLIQ